MDCIFCKIIKGEIPSKTIFEDDVVKVIMDVNPAVDGHALIIPKKHIIDYQEMDKDTLNHIFEVAKNIGPIIMEAMNAKGLTLLVNYKDAQQVKHYHLHLLADFNHSNVKRSVEENYILIQNKLN